MTGKSFSFSAVLGFGWRVMKANFWFFAGVGFVLLLISLSEQILGQIIENYPGKIPPFLVLVLFPLTFIIEIILGIGLIKITLSFCDGRKPRFSTLFNGWDCFWRYLGAGFLYSLIIGGTFIACILPFTLLSAAMRTPYLALAVFFAVSILVAVLLIKFSLCFYFVIDKGLGPINALRASSRATMGAKWSLFVFGILCGLINLLGVLCFIVGVFATFPTIVVAMALVYRQLSAQTPELAELGISSPPDIEPGASPAPPRGGASAGVAGEPQPGAGMRFDAGIQSGLSFRLGEDAQAGAGIRAAPSIQPKGEEKSNNSLLLWVVVLCAGVVIAGGIGYYLWPGTKGAVILHRVALNGILYSEDEPSAIIGGKIVKEGDLIDGVKVVRIHRNMVEFEKNDKRWTQRAR